MIKILLVMPTADFFSPLLTEYHPSQAIHLSKDQTNTPATLKWRGKMLHRGRHHRAIFYAVPLRMIWHKIARAIHHKRSNHDS